ncbi:MAG: hypothetical protein WDZ34_02525 [Candidatus Saccharimonadales bacterium]
MDMDFREPTTHQPQEPMRPVSPLPPAKAKRGGRGKGFLKLLLVLILIAGAGAGGWYYRDTKAKDDSKILLGEISNLTTRMAALQKELDDAKAAQAAESTTKTKPSQADLDNIEAAIKSGNTAALEQLMASKVTVILAASEGLGERTPTQAIKDLDYLDSGTDPWNFDLPAATVDGYQAGDYKQYFPDGALVGKSANNYVVSFSFNDSGKISTIFMSNSADLL